ncbi:HAMP domain-containing sensor histidine kinase [Actinoplanes sp. NPDC049316]|uniref:HAMP domain-containing sensor histidine kinase n=1 Tax=Actinoplanes sp. NPDC049316 TaxID=3154727 RepID=UPI0034240111
MTVIAATAIAVSVFVAFQVASELLGWELQKTAEKQLRADSRVLATNAEQAGLAQVPLPPYPGSGRLVRVILPDGSTRTPTGQPALPPVSEHAGRVAQGAATDLMESIDSDEDGYVIYTLRAGDGAVQVAHAADDSPVNQFGFGMLLIGLLCVAGGGLVGRTVARAGLAPIDRLTAAAVRVAQTRDLDADIPDEGGGEIRRLIQAINDMLAALRDSRRAQRLLAEDAAHELKTPLTSLRLNIELLVRLDRRGTLDTSLSAESRTRLLNDLGAQVAELSTLAAELTDLARGDVSDESTELVDLADVVVAAATQARSRMPDLDLALDVTPVRVSGRPAALRRAVLNLIDNAGKWSPAGVPVQVRLRAEGTSAVLEVDDAGPGIDDADVPRVFDRFYRADSARALPGSGLGLSIVQRVVDAHGGRVTAGRSARGGALLLVDLPAAAPTTR